MISKHYGQNDSTSETIVKPFRGIYYNPSRTTLSEVISPPYDVITPEDKEKLYNRSSFNIVRVDFGKELEGDNDKENKYTRASENLNKWIEEGVLTSSEKPAFYLYECIYSIGKEQKSLKGIFAAFQLVDFGKGMYPHERTSPKPKKDRLDLMFACEANTSPIFSLYNTDEKSTSNIITHTMEREHLIECTDADGVKHRCWAIDNDKEVAAIEAELSGLDFVIADGHHRYETALEYKRQMSLKEPAETGQMSYNRVLMLLVDINSSGLTILPTHRLVNNIPEDFIKRLEPYFTVELKQDRSNITEVLSAEKSAFALSLANSEGYYLLKFEKERLPEKYHGEESIDVTILHEFIFRELFDITDFWYETDIKRVMNMIESSEYEAAFFLNPTNINDVENAAKREIRLPPKSTFFLPKLPTGLLINSFKKI